MKKPAMILPVAAPALRYFAQGNRFYCAEIGKEMQKHY